MHSKFVVVYWFPNIIILMPVNAVQAKNVVLLAVSSLVFSPYKVKQCLNLSKIDFKAERVSNV